ncbi:MAG: ATP-dependent helicase [Lachnospiraceae bacterium]|nr:ATP-dependent helicase [Lachnospiraceae bacterium]
MKRQISPSQTEAIMVNEGPCLVLAGPGSGKTTVITYRTQNLIEKYKVNPANILVVTFTKAAAKEMQQRFEEIMGSEKLPVSFGTFHSVFFNILRYAYNYSAGNIIREEDKFTKIQELIDRENLEIEDRNEFASSVIAEISNVKGDMIDINHYYSTSCSNEVFKRIYNDYEEYLRTTNKVDFDDMMVMCYELFKARKDILAAWQNKYKYILVDEFQDINRIQYEIVKMLALPENNLFIVGDDDQSIYRFRGARPEIMLNFPKEFENTKQVILQENYRSTETIIKASLNLIEHNNNRFKKDIKAVIPPEESVEFLEFKDVVEESKYIIKSLYDYKEGGNSLGNVAILYRTNVDPRFLVEKFMEYNIAFNMKDKLPDIYEHFISKDFISYIKFALGENTRENFFRIMNRPKRYISRNIVKTNKVSIFKLMDENRDKKWLVDNLKKLSNSLQILKRMSPFGAINYIRQGMGYDEFLKEYAEYRMIKVEDLCNIADEITEASREYKTYEEWFAHIDEYKESLKKQIEKNNNNPEAVQLATMHSAKGLEFDTVYIIDAVEGVTPHSKAVLDEDIEEERRLFYVAATRAKRNLKVMWIKEKFHKPVEISRFVEEMQVNGN